MSEQADYIDIEPGKTVVRIYRDGSWLEDSAAGSRQRVSFPETPAPETTEPALTTEHTALDAGGDGWSGNNVTVVIDDSEE